MRWGRLHKDEDEIVEGTVRKRVLDIVIRYAKIIVGLALVFNCAKTTLSDGRGAIYRRCWRALVCSCLFETKIKR
jgi:hypothetical protein